MTGPNGPEAGVWVIAETTDLPTRMIKIVVTDDQGRYVIPELPQGKLHGVGARLWSRQFRQDRRASPARSSTSPPIPAPNEAAAAEYYPAIYWYSMLKIPDKSMFPGTGPQRQRHADLT